MRYVVKISCAKIRVNSDDSKLKKYIEHIIRNTRPI